MCDMWKQFVEIRKEERGIKSYPEGAGNSRTSVKMQRHGKQIAQIRASQNMGTNGELAIPAQKYRPQQGKQ